MSTLLFCALTGVVRVRVRVRVRVTMSTLLFCAITRVVRVRVRVELSALLFCALTFHHFFLNIVFNPASPSCHLEFLSWGWTRL